MGRQKYSTELSYSNGILTARLSGIFNEISAERYRKDLFSAVEELEGAPFALLADISGVEGATPEAFDMVKYIVNQLPSMGLSHKAYVYKGAVIKGIMFQRIPELKELEYLFFENFEDAYAFLLSKTSS